MRWVFASERRWCSSGGVGLGRPFLLGWFVIVSRATWLFLGDGVLVISACGLLLVVGLSHVGSMRVQVGLVGVVVLVYPVGLLFRGVGGGGHNLVPIQGGAGGVVISVAVGACQVAVSVVSLGRVGVLKGW